eukprot:CAMPEP_0197486426 /NCGR_PEP_ID=MMETSP1311-20131121/1372_1 /TAXON_ID=464262 /ORGANISM="Genus nov. species nov., Strain RCC856" /LENGTH=82 /DNA_ID=CAMNT_0043029517 /DNA_START=68 /DNA_END=317 /DNA_ORIENTATION=-
MLAELYSGTSQFAKFARVSAVVAGFSWGVTKLGFLKATTPSKPSADKKHEAPPASCLLPLGPMTGSEAVHASLASNAAMNGI